jgi:adenosylhomocysteine nucleosidase
MSDVETRLAASGDGASPVSTRMSKRVAIVAALEREVKPIVADWRSSDREYGGQCFRIFECDQAVLVCGGIGPEPARRAAQAIISLFAPSELVSVGFAGALDPTLKVGDAFVPRRVVDASDGSVSDIGAGSGTLISFASIAGVGQKEKLARSYGAQAVDMEAAAVARAARAQGLPFKAMKAISDESDFEFPGLEGFIRDGRFCATRFLAWSVAQPWLWLTVVRMARNSARATSTLCAWLEQYSRRPENLNEARPGLHLISK